MGAKVCVVLWEGREIELAAWALYGVGHVECCRGEGSLLVAYVVMEAVKGVAVCVVSCGVGGFAPWALVGDDVVFE